MKNNLVSKVCLSIFNKWLTSYIVNNNIYNMNIIIIRFLILLSLNRYK